MDQYVWDLSYVDAPVVRLHDAENNYTYTDPGDYVHYFTWDANQNVTAAVDEDGAVQERHLYSPYGECQWTRTLTRLVNPKCYVRGAAGFSLGYGVRVVKSQSTHP